MEPSPRMGNIAEDEPLGFSINNRKSAIGNQKFPQPFRRIEMSSANRLFVHHIQCYAGLNSCENRGVDRMLPVEMIVRKLLITSQLSIPKLNRFNLPVDRRGPRAAPLGPPGHRSLNSGQQNASAGHCTGRAGRVFVAAFTPGNCERFTVLGYDDGYSRLWRVETRTRGVVVTRID
jgi:hypothetical protein